MVCQNLNIRTVCNVSQHYMNDASIDASCICVYAKNMALGQVVTHFVGHVDTVWDTKNANLNNIKVKICNYSWGKSLELVKMQSKIFSNVA